VARLDYVTVRIARLIGLLAWVFISGEGAMSVLNRVSWVVGTWCVAVLMSAPAGAVPQIATDFQLGPGGAGSTFTPSYVVSSTDLINGRPAAASSGNFAFELSGGLPVLNDGVYGTITEPGGAPDRTHLAFGVAGGGQGTGTFVTYELDLAASPLGYNLSRVDVFGGWNDSGRDQQAYTVQYSTVASPAAFIDLANVSFNPTIPADTQTANRVTITEDTLPNLATGVAAVRINFSPATENGYSGYAEVDVIGTAVPEPAGMALIALACAVALRRQR
jgi:hypothetical protein